MIWLSETIESFLELADEGFWRICKITIFDFEVLSCTCHVFKRHVGHFEGAVLKRAFCNGDAVHKKLYGLRHIVASSGGDIEARCIRCIRQGAEVLGIALILGLPGSLAVAKNWDRHGHHDAEDGDEGQHFEKAKSCLAAGWSGGWAVEFHKDIKSATNL